MKRKLIYFPFLVMAGLLNSCSAENSSNSTPFQPGGSGDFQGAYLVAMDGQIKASGGQGLANTQTGERNTVDTVFRTGSVTKPITAIAIMQLKEQGKLKLEDPVQRYLPDWRQSQLQIKHLLSHTSGIADVERMANRFQNVLDSKDLYQRILNLGNWGSPSRRFEYSSTNYLLLGIIIEKVSGSAYHSYLDQNIFAPANMTKSGIYFPKTLPSGYAGGNGGNPQFPQESSTFPFSAGAFFTTARDMFQLHTALGNERLLSRSSQMEMMSDVSGGYGFGFMTDGTHPYHPGRIQGYSAMWINTAPSARFKGTIIVLSNGGQRHQIARSYGENLMRQYF
jgi:D-alanyl-D-alanine carboxypeptidase